jgi:hypothetical protein
MQNFNDPSERGSAHNKIIQDYFVYIRAKAHNHSRRNSAMLSPPTERARFFERLDDPELLRETGYLLTQLGHLVKLGPSCEQTIRNYHLKVTQNATALLLKDANPLYRSLAIAMDRVVERFFEMELKYAEVAIEQYKKFESCSRLLAKFYEMATYLPFQGLSPPTFVQRPREVLLSMSAYLDDPEYHRVDSAKVAQNLKMSQAEIDAQCRALEEYEQEAQRANEEDAKYLELISEPDPIPASPATAPMATASPTTQSRMPGMSMPGMMPEFPQPTKADMVMSAFSQPSTGMDMSGMMGGPMMSNPMMSNPMMGNPMMGNPMMGNPMMGNPMMGNPMMGNPMMGSPMMGNPMMNMMAQYMTMSMMGANPYMTGMASPMMTAPQPTPQIRSGLDFASSAYGGAPQRASNPYQSSMDVFGGSTARSSNPFETSSGPFDSAPAQRSAYDAFGNPITAPQQQKAKDPFADLL